jgi:arylsulfatase A-like enzyme
MKPNIFIISVFFLLNALLNSCIPGKEEARKPNIIIILSDDQGWGDLGINGNTNLETPEIDRLAAEGISFDRFFVCPVCSPTRAEMLTGRYHVRGGVYSTSTGGERLDLDETTIAEAFKNAGYATAAYGKWHNGMQPPYHPNARGFDDYYGFCSGHWGNYFNPVLEHNGRIVRGKGFITDDLIDHGLNFIEKNKDNPFFLYLALNTPHSPMQVPDTWWKKFKDKDLSMLHRDREKEDLMFTRSALAMCENIDWNVGRVIDKIEELKIAGNTIIIYFSDNGPNSWRWNDGMKGRKGSTDEGGVRSPLFMKWKGNFEPGKKITQITSVTDLFPTLTDLAGIDAGNVRPFDGVSLKSLLLEDNPQWESRYIFNHWNGRISVRSQKYLLDHEGQLFDMVNDPGQYTDISNDHPEIKKELVAAKDNWVKEVLGELPERDTRSFTIGHPDYVYTQMPARDGIGHGNIIRSARFPNCSFFTNWISMSDSITWDAEVLAEGNFKVTLYYTCPAADTGSVIELSFGTNSIKTTIIEPHNPPLEGMENDRVPRIESYVKDFKPMEMGTIHLEKGRGSLTLKALEIPGAQVMDFRLLMFEKI